MGNPVLSAIADRRSVRIYQDKKITPEQIDTLLTAAQQAPSARNSQPWHFSVVQNPGILKDISDEVSKAVGNNLGDIFFKAPLVIFVSCDASSRWGRLDCGITTATIALAAHSIGLGSVIVGRPEAAFTGPRAAELNKLVRFPEGYSFAVSIAIGVPGGTKEPHPVEPDRITFVD